MALKKKIMITLQVNNDDALIGLKAMEKKRQIKIISEIDYNSPALPGKPMSLKAFRAWIAEAEKSPTISLEESNRRWAAKRKQLLKLAESELQTKLKKTKKKSSVLLPKRETKR
jgi:hypothetical protein